MDFETYELDGAIYDEMFQPDGTPRDHSRQLHEALTRLTSEELHDVQERMTRSFLNEGITFTVYGDHETTERIIPVDCLPRIVSGTEWRRLEAGLSQRILALNRFLADVYGEARIIADGVIPEEIVRDCPHYRAEMRGVFPPLGTWVAICGTDVVRTNDGFLVLEDNLRVPSGVSHDRQPAGGKVEPAPALSTVPRARGRTVRPTAARDAARTRPARAGRSLARAANARSRQLCLLRTHVSGQ